MLDTKTISQFVIPVFAGLLITCAAVSSQGEPGVDPAGIKQQNRRGPVMRVISGGYPIGLPLCTKNDDLQQCLDANKIIRLEIGDYRIHNKGKLNVKSGQQLFGLPGTQIPSIELQAGTESAVLSTLTTEKVEFVSDISNSPIRLNKFIRVNAFFNDIGAVVEQNTFIYCNGRLNVDNSKAGFLRGNKFIGSHAHSQSDMLTIKGDKDQLSYGNTFLWYNFLTPHGRTAFINSQKDISFIGIDGETWNKNGEDSAWAPMLDLNDVSEVRVFSANGGNHGAYPTPFIRANAKQVQILNMNVFNPPISILSDSAKNSPWRPTTGLLLNQILLGDDNNLSWVSHFCCVSKVSYPSFGTHFELFQSRRGPLKINDAVVDAGSMPHTVHSLVRELFAPGNRDGQPWEKASFVTLPDPMGPDWKALIGTAIQKGVDNSSFIQNLIDRSSDGVALLPAGTYYISKPLVLGKNKGLVGAGMDKTVILALSDSLDMIVPGDSLHPNSGGTQRFILSDLTLQGGHSGIFYSNENSGSYTQLNDVFLSYVQFREMSGAGILFRDIYGFDNNLFDHLAFVNCRTGFKQEFPTDPRAGENSDNNYVDKTIFYQTQFIGNKMGVDFSAHRVDTLNAFIYSLFKGNESGAITLQNAVTTIFARTEFINNGGDAVVKMSNAETAAFVGCEFIAGPRGKVFFSGGVNIEGSVFSQGQAGNARVFKDGSVGAALYNSSGDTPLGQAIQGVFINSKFIDPGFDRFFVMALGNGLEVYSIEVSNPREQLLWEASFR